MIGPIKPKLLGKTDFEKKFEDFEQDSIRENKLERDSPEKNQNEGEGISFLNAWKIPG